VNQSSAFATDQVEITASPAAVVEPRWWPCLILGAAYWIVFLPAKFLADSYDSDLIDFPSHLISLIVVSLSFMTAWLGFSRRSWGERLSGLGTFLGTAVVASQLAESKMKLGLVLHALPTALLLWGVWGFATRRQPSLTHRRVTLAMTMLVTAAYFCLLRFDGIDGATRSSLSWRWTPTAEQRFLESLNSPPKSETIAEETLELTLQAGDWPGFRGPQRDSVVRGVRFETDWSRQAPKVVWQQAIGPGLSSFAVVSDRLFTQEQRGDDECVTCYDAATGAEIWCHRNATRHTDPISGAGPRGTPQFAASRLFAQGANGDLLCLDAATGKELWKANIQSDSQAELPKCGFSGSPLVMGGVVVTIPGGAGSGSVVAYRESNGLVAWKAGQGISGYASPHPAKLLGQQQVITLTDEGALSLDAGTGHVLWNLHWTSNSEPPITQPLVVDSSKVVIPAGQDLKTRLVEVKCDADKWSVTELWTSNEFRPYFNDYVLHAGHAFGFDGAIFCCVDLATGKRRWKKGRYGRGQVLLLAEQALLLVTSETGVVVLLEANPLAHAELSQFSALDGRTWNHPAIVRDQLFIRNGERLACIKLPTRTDPRE